jgi:hypothetical protein
MNSMYTSFDDIFLAPPQVIDWSADVIITDKGRFIKLTRLVLEKILNVPLPRKHRYKVLPKPGTYDWRTCAYDYLCAGAYNEHHIKTHAGMEVTIQEFLDHKFGYQDMWICDISRASEQYDEFTELRSGIDNAKAVMNRMDIFHSLISLMLTYDADVATNGSMASIHDRTVEWLDKLGEREQYDRHKRLYARMRAKLVVYMRRFVVPDIARMVVAMAYP